MGAASILTIMMDNRGQVVRRGRGFDKRPRVRAMGKYRTVRKERGVGDKHDVRIRLIKLGTVSDRERAAFVKNQIKHHHIERPADNQVNRIIARLHMRNLPAHPLQMAGPEQAEFKIALDDENTHESSDFIVQSFLND